MTDLHNNVAIFWDYENCHPSSNVPGYEIADTIRSIAHKYGVLKQFKAYLELAEQVSAKSSRLCSELQSSGVSLTDCSHNGRKDVADKMILVDMLAFALDNPAPATAILISGDRDFAYAVSILRNRRYQVVLVAPENAHISLKYQASAVLDWNADVLEKCVFGTLDLDSGSFPASCRGEKTVPKHSKTAHFPQSALFQSPLKPSTPKLSKDLSFSTRMRSMTTSLEDIKTPWSGTGPGLHLSNGLSGWSSMDNSNRIFDQYSAPSRLAAAGPNGSAKPSNFPAFADDWRPQWPLGVTDSRRASHAKAMSVPNVHLATKPEGVEISGPRSADHAQRVETPCTGAAMQRSEPAADDTNHVPLSVNANVAPKERRAPRKRSTASSLTSHISAPSAQVSVEQADSDASQSYQLQNGRQTAAPSRILDSLTLPTGQRDPVRLSNAPVDVLDDELPLNTPLPPSPGWASPFGNLPSESQKSDESPRVKENVIPTPKFLPLVEHLTRLRLAGNDKPLRSIVGQALISHNPMLYKEVGVLGFSQYAALAQQSGIIELGGIGGKAWIFLKAESV